MIQDMERLCEIYELVNEIGVVDTANRLNLAIGTVERYCREYTRKLRERQVESIQDAKATTEKVSMQLLSETRQKDTINQTLVSSDRFTTVEQIAEYCHIDMAIWECTKITAGSYGYNNNPAWQFKTEWKRYQGVSPQMVLDKLKHELNSYKIPHMPEYKRKIGNVLLEISINDLHLGRLSWAKETGKPYDVRIAMEEFAKAHSYFYEMHKHLDIDTVIMPIGNDFFNVDNNINQTAHGTPQMEDGRWQRSFSKGCDAAISAIEFWRSKGMKVVVKIIPGNHDLQRIYYLGAYLDAWYRNIESVEIDNAPTMRKYYVFGINLIGFSHGQKDFKRLKSIYQSEMREYMSQCTNIEFHTGHLHQEKVVEDFGSVIIRVIPSLAEKSNWEKEMGFSGNRRAQAFAWHKEKGLLNINYYTPDFN